jgi:hypothetical protein
MEGMDCALRVCGIDGYKWAWGVQGLGARPPQQHPYYKDEGMRACQMSITGLLAGLFRPPRHHDRVHINFLSSGVAMRLQLRVPYSEE